MNELELLTYLRNLLVLHRTLADKEWSDKTEKPDRAYAMGRYIAYGVTITLIDELRKKVQAA